MCRFECYLIRVGIISAVKRMLREAAAWEANRPSAEKTVMAISLRSKGHKDRLAPQSTLIKMATDLDISSSSSPYGFSLFRGCHSKSLFSILTYS